MREPTRDLFSLFPDLRLNQSATAIPVDTHVIVGGTVSRRSRSDRALEVVGLIRGAVTRRGSFIRGTGREMSGVMFQPFEEACPEDLCVGSPGEVSAKFFAGSIVAARAASVVDSRACTGKRARARTKQRLARAAVLLSSCFIME